MWGSVYGSVLCGPGADVAPVAGLGGLIWFSVDVDLSFLLSSAHGGDGGGGLHYIESEGGSGGVVRASMDWVVPL